MIFDNKSKETEEKILRRARRHARRIVEEARAQAEVMVGQRYQEALTSFAQRLETELARQTQLEIARFTKSIEEKIMAQDQMQSSAVAGQFAEAKKQIEAYKVQKIAELDKKFKEVIVDATKQLLGEAIDPQTHEKLILKALEDAKRSNLL